jgi:hypothetical protein
MVLAIVLMGLALVLPVEYTLTEPETPSAVIKAPWLIAWLQVLLRHFRPGIAAFFIPLAIVAIAASLPWLPGAGRSDLSITYRFRPHQAILLTIALALALLTFWGL